MRAALFHPWIYLRGGVERTLLELASRSRHDWTLYTGRYKPEDTFAGFKSLDVVEMLPISVARRVGPVAQACLRLITHNADWSGYDAAIISCDGIGNLLTLRSHGVPLACLCHTPLKIAYDPETSARWHQLKTPDLATRLGVRLFAYADRFTWQRYDRIFCVSSEVRSRILRGGLVDSERTEVLHPGVDIDRFQPSGRREPFFLLPGRIMWTKNIELGIRAFVDMKDALGGSGSSFRLVIAGMVDDKSREYAASLRALAAGRGDIEFVVSPSDQELLDLYDRCHAVLFTALNEDWGLVPVEAMAFGKPVIAVDRGGPAESVIHGETGFLCPPEEATFASAMGLLATSHELTSEMSGLARARAGNYHWDTFVQRMDEYVEEAGRRRGLSLVRAS